MNPMSLLTLPTNLLQAAVPSERRASPHSERRERQAALAFVASLLIGLMVVVVMR